MLTLVSTLVHFGLIVMIVNEILPVTTTAAEQRARTLKYKLSKMGLDGNKPKAVQFRSFTEIIRDKDTHT
jgi:hypothetical protein